MVEKGKTTIEGIIGKVKFLDESRPLDLHSKEVQELLGKIWSTLELFFGNGTIRDLSLRVPSER